jgi:hypothetical protein
MTGIGLPIVLVFDGEGKRARKVDRIDPDNQSTYADVQKFVVELLDHSKMKPVNFLGLISMLPRGCNFVFECLS